MATTSSSWITSREPETIKHRLSMLSPVWYIRSPGAEWVMVKCIARARRQPSLARRNAGCSLNTFLFRCTQISAFISFGQKSSTYNDDSQILYGISFLIGFWFDLIVIVVLIYVTYLILIQSFCHRPGRNDVIHDSLWKGGGDFVKFHKFSDAVEHIMIFGGCWCHLLNDCCYMTKDGSIK